MWIKRLCALLGKLSNMDVATFRNNYRDVLALAAADPKLPRGALVLLERARDFVEQWTSTDPSPDPNVTYDQWMTLQTAGKLPDEALTCILRLFPQFPPDAVTWDSFLLSSTNEKLVSVLLDRRLITQEDLNRLARETPEQFYQSAAFDVLVRRHALRETALLWLQCTARQARPRALLSREEALVACYGAILGTTGDVLLTEYLDQHRDDQQRILDVLLDDRHAVLRLADHLLQSLTSGSAPARDRRTQKPVALLLRMLVDRCEVEMNRNVGERLVTASIILGLMRLKTAASPTREDELDATATRLTHDMALRALRETTAGGAVPAVVLRGNELSAIAHEYLRSLPAGTRSGADAAAGSSVQLERHLASRDTLEQVVHAMDQPFDERGLRDAIEVAVYNCGVRPFGTVGERLEYDSRMHDVQGAPGVLPDDPVVVTRPGRTLGEGETRVVLLRAKVTPTVDS